MESGAGVLVSPRLLAVLLAAVGCAVWLLAGGCAPAAVIGWPLPCALLAFALLAVACGGLSGWPAGWRLAAVLCRCCWRLSGCALLGGYRGRIYQAPRRLYRARKTLPARLAVSPAACFRRRPCAASEAVSGPPPLAAGPAFCRSTCGRSPWCFSGAGLLPAGPLRWAALHGKRHGTPHGKRRRKRRRKRAGFSGPLSDGSRRSRFSTRPGSTVGRRAGDHAGGRRKFPAIFPARYFTRPV